MVKRAKKYQKFISCLLLVAIISCYYINYTSVSTLKCSVDFQNELLEIQEENAEEETIRIIKKTDLFPAFNTKNFIASFNSNVLIFYPEIVLPPPKKLA